jgi:hypothetical protein
MRTSTSSTRGSRGRGEGRYPLAADVVGRAGRVAMPRLPRLYAPGGTVHVVGRCNNGEFCFRTPDDFQILLTRLEKYPELWGDLYAYTLMANHVHLLLRRPDGALGAAAAGSSASTRAWRTGASGAILGTPILEATRWTTTNTALASLRSQSIVRSQWTIRRATMVQCAASPWGAQPAGSLSPELSRAQCVPSSPAHYRRCWRSDDPRADARDPVDHAGVPWAAGLHGAAWSAAPHKTKKVWTVIKQINELPCTWYQVPE